MVQKDVHKRYSCCTKRLNNFGQLRRCKDLATSIANCRLTERSAYVCDDVCSAEGIDEAPIEFVEMVLGRGTFGMKELIFVRSLRHHLRCTSLD